MVIRLVKLMGMEEDEAVDTDGINAARGPDIVESAVEEEETRAVEVI